MVVVVVSLSRNNEILAICLGRDDTDGVFVSRASVRSWRPFNGIQQATMINLPKFRRPQVSNFFSAEVFWKFENLSGFNEAELSTTDCSLAIFILDYTNTCYCKFCSIIVNNPCTLDKPIFMTFYQYNNQWKRIAAATVNSRQSTRDVADEK